jgi:peptidylprolyl isomerase
VNETPGSTKDAKDKGAPAPGKSAASDPKVRFLIGAVVVLAVVVGGGFALGFFGVDNTDLSTKPQIKAGSGDPPTELVIEDIVEGSGPAATTGDTVEVQYVGALFEDGTEFDSSWTTGQPFTVTLGSGQVIEGWEQGLIGIRKGGRREIIIPSGLGYGATGQPPTIPPDSALIFIVDAEKVTPGNAGGQTEQ